MIGLVVLGHPVKMSDSEKSALISEFSAVTGVDGERARFYLESSQWKLDVRIN